MPTRSELPLEDVVAGMARRQHGLVTLAQVRSAGMSRGVLRSHLDRGDWVRAEYRVYRIYDGPLPPPAVVMAAVLAAGPGAVVSHRSAAALWGLDSPGTCDCVGGCSDSTNHHTAPYDLSLPRHRRFRRPGLAVHRSSDLHLTTPVLRDHIPTTPIARTLLDLGAVARRRVVLAAVQEARDKGLVDWDELLEVLVRHARRGRDGVGKMRSVLAQCADPDLAHTLEEQLPGDRWEHAA